MTNSAPEPVHTATPVENPSTEASPLLLKSGRVLEDGGDDTQSALSKDNEVETAVPGTAGLISLLLIGVFMVHADGTLIIPIYGTIASQFHQLSNGSWLATSFLLASCAAQPITGRLSDIYGRKTVLLVSYTFFALGTLGTGIGQTMSQVITGRIIAGIGGAGMTVLVSILITDLVPKLQIAAWRSYVNVAATIGRSLGGPVGGWLADAVGWRWSFIAQVPVILVAIAFIGWKLKTTTETKQEPEVRKKLGSKLGQIDFVGALLIVAAVVSLLLILDLGGRRMPWSSPTIIALVVSSIVSGAAFCWYDSKVARLPIFSPALLLQRSVWTSYSIAMFQIAAQVAIIFSIPMYFQVTEDATNTVAGLHLIPAVLGNTIGGLAAGYFIAKTGRYKLLTIFATICGIATYLVLILRWHGRISLLESLEIFPGGFGTGMAGASAFIIMTSDLASENMAMGTSGMYLFSGVGQIAGVSLSFAVQQGSLKSILRKRITGRGSRKIIEDALSDVSKIHDMKEPIKTILVESYVKSIENSHIAALCCSVVAFIVALTIREHPLKK